jgi:hypothetical protein
VAAFSCLGVARSSGTGACCIGATSVRSLFLGGAVTGVGDAALAK